MIDPNKFSSLPGQRAVNMQENRYYSITYGNLDCAHDIFVTSYNDREKAIDHVKGCLRTILNERLKRNVLKTGKIEIVVEINKKQGVMKYSIVQRHIKLDWYTIEEIVVN